jgi:hypothetical protein
MDQEALKRQLLETYLKQQNLQNFNNNLNLQQQQMLHKAAQQHRAHQQMASSVAPSVASSVSSSTRTVQRPVPIHEPKTLESTGRELVMLNPDDVANENITLEEFKEFVKKWFELDNMIKKTQELIRDKKKTRDKLSMLISRFMCKYDIEDLNTKEGRIRCKVKQVKEPINKKVVMEKITDYFKNDETKKNEIMTKIYDERHVVEKVSLRRLKIS